MQKFFYLQEGEKIIREIKPSKRFILYMAFFNWRTILGFLNFLIIGYAIAVLIAHINLSIYNTLSTTYITPSDRVSNFSEGTTINHILIFYSLFLFILCGIWLLFAWNRYRHEYYWITNKRLIQKKGLFGYTMTSVPLERISDIKISRTFLERICGIASLRIETLAGQFTPPKGGEIRMIAVPAPEELQVLIFKLIQEKRKEEGLTM